MLLERFALEAVDRAQSAREKERRSVAIRAEERKMRARVFAENLSEARESAKMSLEELGEKVSCTAKAIAKYEEGSVLPSLDRMRALGRALTANLCASRGKLNE